MEYIHSKTGRRILSNDQDFEEENAINTNIFEDNTAAYGNNIASYPANFRYTFE